MTTERVFKKLGVIGFCFGGGKVLEVLGQDQDACFATGHSFYGTRLDVLVGTSDVKNIQTKIDRGSKVVNSPVELMDLPTDLDLCTKTRTLNKLMQL